MQDFVKWALCGLNFLLLISGGILCFGQSPRRFRRRLLGCVFFILAWHVFFVILKDTGLLADYPFVLRTVCPFYYLVPALLYLHARSHYYDENGFRKGDWIHFVLFFLALIDVAPYVFFTSPALKHLDAYRILHEEPAIVSVASGFLPAVTHYILRILVWPVYVFFHGRLVGYALRQRRRDGAEFRGMFMTAAVLNVLLCAANMFALGPLVLKRYGFIDVNAGRIVDVVSFVLILASLGLCVYLFSRPAFLYHVEAVPAGKEDSAPADNEAAPAEEKDTGGTASSACGLVERLEEYLKETEAYRRQGVKIADVAAGMDVNPYLLSQAINSHFGQRFNDYINAKRVAFIKELIAGGAGLKKLTIEGLAAEAGFSSRTPFYAAFRKITGLTPSEYIAEVSASKEAEDLLPEEELRRAAV